MDRSHEHLGTTDRPIILMRRQLLRAVEDVRNGRDPLLVERDGQPNALQDLFVRANPCRPQLTQKAAGGARGRRASKAGTRCGQLNGDNAART